MGDKRAPEPLSEAVRRWARQDGITVEEWKQRAVYATACRRAEWEQSALGLAGVIYPEGDL